MYNTKEKSTCKPFNDIFSILSSPRKTCDPRLTKLWSEFIGEKVEIDVSIKNVGELQKEICEMFTTDNIAYTLMKELVLYKPNIEKIIIKQDYSRVDLNGNPTLLGLTNFLQNTAKNPVLIVERNSNFVAIISTNHENDNIVEVHYWQLSIQNTSQNSKQNLSDEYDEETLYDKTSRKYIIDKLIIDKSISTQIESIHHTLLHMLYKDPIKNNLTHQIMDYAYNFEGIYVRQNYFPTYPGKQNIHEITSILRTNYFNPVLVLESQSNFVAIITEKPDEKNKIILYIWDLNNLI